MSITEDITPGPHPVQYWYNTFTGQVEEGQQSKITHLWGPYATREEAEKAMETAQKRNEEWDNQDPKTVFLRRSYSKVCSWAGNSPERTSAR